MKVARFCMWVAIVIWAVWLGGQTYHALTVIPMWSVNPPDSLHAYARLGEQAKTVPFFLVFSTVWPSLLSLIAFFISRALPWPERKWIAFFAAGAILISAALIAWMAPTIWSIFKKQYASSAEGAATFALWRTANYIRIVCELVVFLIGLRALIALSGRSPSMIAAER